MRREQITARDFCVIVDDFLAEPNALVEYACSHPSEFSHPNIGYPGVQIRVNDDAMAEIYRFVAGTALGQETPENRDKARSGRDIVRLLAEERSRS